MLKRLISAPGFTAITLLTLLLGIGVNVSMLSVLDVLIYREAPYPDADQLVLLSRETPQKLSQEFSGIEFLELQEHLGPDTPIVAFSRHQAILSSPDRPPENLEFVTSSPELFSVLQVTPLSGRPFTARDVAEGRTDIAVISHSFWQQRFNGSPDIIGQPMQIGEKPVTIIGVMPATFEWIKLWGSTQLWQPLTISAAAETARQHREFTLLARRPSDISVKSIEAALGTLATAQRTNSPHHYEVPFRYEVAPVQLALTNQLTGQFAWLLTSLAGFVLLIACANLANLQLARSSERTKEFAIRLALGSSRGQLLRNQLREPLVLSVAGGLLGLLLALGLNQVIAQRLRVRGSPSPLDMELDPPLVAAALGIALFSGLAFGLLPAWSSTRVNPNAALKSQDRGSTGNRHSRRLRHGLIVAEIALALMLLSGAVTMQRGFENFMVRPAGWDSDRVVSANLPIPAAQYSTSEDRLQLFEYLERELPQIPGVTEAAISTSTPALGYTNPHPVLTDDQNPQAPATHSNAFHVVVSHRYFATMGMTLRQGRTFSPDIARTDPRVVVINASLARHLWPNKDPIGQRLGTMYNGRPAWAEVIGVVNDVVTVASLTKPETPFTVYKPIAHEIWDWVMLTLRSSQPATQIDPLRATLRDIAPDLVIGDITTPVQLVDRTLHNLRIATQILSLFGLLGLGLATIGIYGVVAHLISHRTREFGIRMALGARPRDIIWLVMRQSAWFIGVGVGLGSIGAFGLNALLHRLIPEFTKIDPIALIGVAVFLAAVAMLACLLPTRRAVKLDPVVALHDD